MRTLWNGISLALSLSAPAFADEASPLTVEPFQTVFAFMTENQSCLSATDRCVICARKGSELNCSTPAIACVVAAPACTSWRETPKAKPDPDGAGSDANSVPADAAK